MKKKKPAARKATRKPAAKRDEKTVRKVTKTGEYTYYVTIPKSYISALKWKERQKVVVKMVGKKLIIEDWKEKKKKKR
jgi:bifunctional DNA-binding transcriptional regulator/antitoxin component of YhaV-PrlF toxin-antitoxin module